MNNNWYVFYNKYIAFVYVNGLANNITVNSYVTITNLPSNLIPITDSAEYTFISPVYLDMLRLTIRSNEKLIVIYIINLLMFPVQ